MIIIMFYWSISGVLCYIVYFLVFVVNAEGVFVYSCFL